MSLPKIFLTVSISLFALIGVLALVKKGTVSNKKEHTAPVARQEVELSLLGRPQEPVRVVPPPRLEAPVAVVIAPPVEEQAVVIEHDVEPEGLSTLFAKNSNCPIVETVVYKSHVPWKHQRSAWLIDYAQHYRTPLDFIYGSLNGNGDFSPKNVSEGTAIRVLKKDLTFRFHMVVSLSSCRLRLYYVLPKDRRAVFLKTYQVGVGRKDASKPSGSLTPTGLYQLGSRVGVFRPRMTGMYRGKKVELMRVFGCHWIPFEKEIRGCSEPAKGLGIHGVPMDRNEQTGELVENIASLGHYESDGCIRLAGKDIHELFAIVSTRQTFIEIVPTFQHSALMRGEIES
jgi:lipoprotein-anchoring transpeptidase ErfK/SrfK